MNITNAERQMRQETFLSSTVKKRWSAIMVIIAVSNDEHKTLLILFSWLWLFITSIEGFIWKSCNRCEAIFFYSIYLIIFVSKSRSQKSIWLEKNYLYLNLQTLRG